jgi:DNA-binding LacI/PurR family transcriptional regulator
MQQQAQHYGYVPVSYFMGGMSREQRQELLYKIAARRPLALLLFLECMNAEWIEQAQQMGVEHILLGTAEPLTDPLLRAFPSVSLPVREIGYVAAQHLLERGHRHLAVVHPGDGRHEQAFQERLQGMQEALMKWSGMADVQLDILPLHLSLADAQDLVARYFCGPLHPTGVYAFNDEYALPLMAALSDRGLSIPTDVAMIGTDNTSFSAFVRPALTTISFDNVAFGHRFIDILHVLQQGKPLPEELMRPLVPQLILRAST